MTTAPHQCQESNQGREEAKASDDDETDEGDEEEQGSTSTSRGKVDGVSERRTDQDELRAGQSCRDQDRRGETNKE